MKKGFTLIELLIVIAIIGVLAVALLPTITGGPGKARDAARTTALNNIATVLENYNLDKGRYPENGAGAANCLKDSDGPGAELAPYFKSGISHDPSTDRTYTVNGQECSGQYYYSKFPAGGYVVATSMENETNNNTKMAGVAMTYDAIKANMDANKEANDNTHYVVISK